MLSTFPAAWLVLALPFLSAGVIAHVQPLRDLTARRHRTTWTAGVVGLFTFTAGLIGLLPTGWTIAAVLGGGAVAGFACFWTTSTDDGDDWRDSPPGPDDDGPRDLPDIPIDWQRFDRLRAQWASRPRVRP